MVVFTGEHDNRSAESKNKHEIGESSCRLKRDRRSVGVAAQKTIGARKHADAHGNGGEEDLRCHGVLCEIKEVALVGKLLDVAGQGVLPGENHAGELQQHK